MPPTRERRWWTSQEDEILKNGVQSQRNALQLLLLKTPSRLWAAVQANDRVTKIQTGVSQIGTTSPYCCLTARIRTAANDGPKFSWTSEKGHGQETKTRSCSKQFSRLVSGSFCLLLSYPWRGKLIRRFNAHLLPFIDGLKWPSWSKVVMQTVSEWLTVCRIRSVHSDPQLTPTRGQNVQNDGSMYWDLTSSTLHGPLKRTEYYWMP